MVGEYLTAKNDEIDAVFATMIDNIKSSALEKSTRGDRQIVAAWINKLCECPNTETEKRNRNLYSQILLKMLGRSQLKKPFTEKPLPGKLPTIPVYMSDYLDETGYVCGNHDDEPIWLLGSDDSMFLKSFDCDKPKDVDVGQHSLFSKIGDASEFFQIPEADELELYLSTDERIYDKKKNITKDPLLNPPVERTNDFESSLTDNSLLRKFENIANTIRYPVLKQHLSAEEISKEKALEKKLEFLGKKIETESSKIQKQQDTMIKNILDRKNNEMNELKISYQKKVSEFEAVVGARDETISMLNTKLKDAATRHDAELHIVSSESIKQKENASKKTSLRENEMLETMNKMKLEMTHLKRSHFENIEKLNVENENDIAKCKEKMASENEKLKENIAKLSENIEFIEEVKKNFAKEKDDCIAREKEYVSSITRLEEELSKSNGSLSCLDNEVIQLSNEKHRLERKIEDLENNALKSDKTISTLQTKIKEFKKALDSLTANKQSEVRELKVKTKEKIVEIESFSKNKISILENDFNTKAEEYDNQLKKSAQDIAVKNKEIKTLTEKNNKLLVDTKRALEVMKRKAEENYFKIFDSLNVKMNKLQSSVNLSQEKLKLQKSSIARSVENQRKKHSDFKQVQSQMLGKHNLDLMQLKEKLARQKREYEEKLKGLLPLHMKSDLEDTIESMRQQIGFLQSETDLLHEEVASVTTLNQSLKVSGYQLNDSSCTFNE